MPILYKCTWRGCSKILEQQGYCKIHEAKVSDKKRQRYKEYDEIRKIDEEHIKYRSLYDSTAWKKIRDAAISECYGIDIVEYYRTGKVIQGLAMHHIQTLEDKWKLRLDVDNLIYLTEKNHRRVHVEYVKGDKEKRIMQELLFDLKCGFTDEFEV